MISVLLDVDATEPLRALEMFERRTEAPSMRMFMQRMAAPFLKKRAETRFGNEGDDATGAWTQLAYTTGLIRTAQGFAAFHPINVRSGALRRFVTTNAKINAVGAHGASVRMPGTAGGNLMQAKLQVAQQGGGTKSPHSRFTGPHRPAPPRPVLALSVQDQVPITYGLLNWIRTGVP